MWDLNILELLNICYNNTEITWTWEREETTKISWNFSRSAFVFKGKGCFLCSYSTNHIQNLRAG